MRKIFERVLNLGAGKLKPLELMDKFLLLNVDKSYYDTITPAQVEQELDFWTPFQGNRTINLNEDIFTFMERTRHRFHRVILYRILEHISFTQVPYFIYLISTVLEKGGEVDVIVPNYETLARVLINEKVADLGDEFESHNILLTTELLNEPSCPHASVWTRDRLMYYFCYLEKRFKDSALINPAFEFDGRDIYLRAKFTRV